MGEILIIPWLDERFPTTPPTHDDDGDVDDDDDDDANFLIC